MFHQYLNTTGSGPAKLLFLSIAVIAFPAEVFPVEITPFGVTGVDSSLEFRYVFDNFESRSRSIRSAQLDQTIYEAEAQVMVHSYIFHPVFIKADFGGGAIAVQNTLDEMSGKSGEREMLYNFSGRLSFLEKKPYPFMVYYEQDNPPVYPGLVERLNQENRRTGLQFRLLQPLLPFDLSINASKRESEGSSENRIIDETEDRADVRAARVFSDRHRASLTYMHSDRESATGNRALPINLVAEQIDKTDLESTHSFGSREQVKISNYASFTENEGAVSRDTLRFAPNLDWDNSDKLQTHLRFNLQRSRQEGVDTDIELTRSGFAYHVNEQLDTNGSVYLSHEDTTGLNNRTAGAASGVSYVRPIGSNRLQLAATLQLDQSDRQASADEIQILGEIVVLFGFTPVSLNKEYVNTSTIVVSNASRSQTFVQGLDYRIVVIGARTDIERVAGSSILDGESLLVDYSYESGGTLGYRNVNQSYQAIYSLADYIQITLRYRDSDRSVVTGVPLFPLNSIQNKMVGFTVDEYPLSETIRAGGSLVIESQAEVISSYDRQNLDSYVSFQLPRSTFVRVSARYSSVDNHESPEDIKLRGIRVMLRSRPWRYTTLSAELSKEVDSGGTLIRKMDLGVLRFLWRIRKFGLEAEMRFSHEQHGDFKRDRASIKATLRRDI